MLWKLLVAAASIISSPWRAPIDPDQAFQPTPYGPQNREELQRVIQALHGKSDDIRYIPGQPSHAGTSDLSSRWPGNTVVYHLAPEVQSDKKLVKLIEQAIKQYEKNTCIRFRKAKNDKTYVRIFKDDDGCYSNLGRIPQAYQPQNLSLGEGCDHVGVVVHELGHAIGLYHEHQRSDRDNYINVYPKNVEPGLMGNFDKTPKSNEMTFGAKYDYTSIMHYGECAFAKEDDLCPTDKRYRTMEAKDGKTRLLEPYDRPGLNKNDIALVKKLYKCK